MVHRQLTAALAAKLHILVRGFKPVDWERFGHACICTAFEPLRLGWPAGWVSNIMCSIAYPPNRPAVRVCRLLALWIRHQRPLVQKALAQQRRLGHEYGMGALYDYISDVFVKYRERATVIDGEWVV